MMNKSFLVLCAVLLIAATTAQVSVEASSRTDKSASGKSRPNILFMLTDDQRFDDMGCMGNKIIQTPNLDKLAGDGVIFNNAFVTTAICCSSRASILTGQHMRRHRIYDFATPLSSEAVSYTHLTLPTN